MNGARRNRWLVALCVGLVVAVPVSNATGVSSAAWTLLKRILGQTQTPDDVIDPIDQKPKADLGGPRDVLGLGLASTHDLYATYSHADIQVRTPLGPFSFVRRFNSNPKAERNQNFPGFGVNEHGAQNPPVITGPMPGAPFGVDRHDAQRAPVGPSWTHNLFAYAQTTNDGGWQVRDGSGAVYMFSPAPGDGGYAFGLDSYDSDVRWNGTVLVKPGVGRFVYGSSRLVVNGRSLLLMSIEDERLSTNGTPRVRVTLDYSVPACAAYTAATNPYVSKATFADGSKLVFHYDANCLLTSVDLVSAAGAVTTPVSYSYQALANGMQILGQATFPELTAGGLSRTLTYTYSGQATDVPYTRVQVNENGRFVSSQYAAGAVSLGQVWAMGGQPSTNVIQTADAIYNVPQLATQYPAPTGFEWYPQSLQSGGGAIEDTNVPLGDGSGAVVNVGTVYRTALPKITYITDLTTGKVIAHPPVPALFPGELTRVVNHSCGAASCPSINNNAFSEWGWYPMDSHIFTGGASYWQWEPYVYVDTLSHFTTYSWDAGTPAAATAFQAVGLKPLRELQTVLEGALDADGGSPMRRRDYTYEYGTGGTPPMLKQFVKTKTEASSFAGGPAVVTTYVHDLATNRLKAVLRTGQTYVFSGTTWQKQPRTVGTFYFNAYQLPPPGGLPSGAGVSPDPMNRILEVHGPCIANSGGTDCAAGQMMPLNQYVYYSPTDTASNHAGRLYSASRSASNTVTEPCSGSAANRLLTTTINTYDARGHATSVTDENGVTTTYSYVEDALISKATGGVTWTYGWEDGRVKSVCESVTGACEFTCYRGSASAACTGGALSDKLQWKSKAKNSTGTPWTEKVAYGYTHGRLTSETYYDAAATIRRVVRHDADPLNRPTFEGTGSAGVAGSYSQVALFDSEGNRIAVGLPYNAAPSFCGGLQGTNDSLCAVLSYDRLNRLTSLKEAGVAPSGSACIRYDGQDNVSGIDLTCGDNSQGHAAYQYDDFGNLSWVSGSWMALPDAGTPALGATPATLFEYDGAGHLIRKQTPSMQAASQWQESKYDALGRELTRDVVTSTTRQNLFGFCYDRSIAAPPSGCPAPTYGNGRVERRQDSFGLTWYQYDALGHLQAEVRTRGTTPTSCAVVTCVSGASCPMSLTASDTQVNTEYAVDAIGRVQATKYPHGRVVRFDYGDGTTQSVDRVVAVRADFVVAGAISPQLLLSKIQWEPYAGLRAYEGEAISAAAGQQQFAVEYLLGDNGTAALNTQCNQARPSSPGDATGRLRGLWVSAGPLDGTGTGGILHRSYQWRGDQLAAQSSCLLAPTSQQAIIEYYSYDSRLRVTGATRPTAAGSKFWDTGGSIGRRGYSYDNAGNRLTGTEDCWVFTGQYDSVRRDLLKQYSAGAGSGCQPHLCTGSPSASWAYTYDADGRAATRVLPATGPSTQALVFDSQMDGTHAAQGSVFKSVTVNGTPKYEYFYDADGRRRLKQYPQTGKDEFFYSATHEFLEDRGLVNSDASPVGTDAHPIDEYVWLDGRPAVLLKSSFDSTWKRRDEYGPGFVPKTGSCNRGPEYPDCGAFFLITDYLKKPVLLLNTLRQVAGEAHYDVFGHVNRVTSVGDAGNAIGPGTEAVLGFFRQPVTANVQVRLRARYALVNTSGANYASLYDSGHLELNVIGTTTPARNSGSAGISSPVSGWVPVPASNGRVQARSTSRSGVALGGYEYRRSQSGVNPVWTALRFPGQYHDVETDLFQNWNRFYDPLIGRYLESEALWDGPGALRTAAGAGRLVPTYAYGGNNPLQNSDPDGKIVPLILALVCAGGGCEALVTAAVVVTGAAAAIVTAKVAVQIKNEVLHSEGQASPPPGASPAGGVKKALHQQKHHTCPATFLIRIQLCEAARAKCRLPEPHSRVRTGPPKKRPPQAFLMALFERRRLARSERAAGRFR